MAWWYHASNSYNVHMFGSFFVEVDELRCTQFNGVIIGLILILTI